MLSVDIDDYKIGEYVLFHDENQCEIRGFIRGKRYGARFLSLTVEQEGRGYYEAKIPKTMK